MATALGHFLIRIATQGTAVLPSRALRSDVWPGSDRPGWSLALHTPSPGLSIACSGDVRYSSGTDRGGLGLARAPASSPDGAGPSRAVDGALRRWADGDAWEPKAQRGRFVYACWDVRSPALVLFTDLFRTYPVYYRATSTGLICASDLRLVIAARDERPAADPIAVYHYLNFAYVPAPRSAVQGVSKMEAGSRLDWSAGRLSIRRFIDATYPEDLRGQDAERAEALREYIVSTVLDHRPGSTTPWGTYLSGGTDSSSIAGILARADRATPVDTYSIGFGEGAFDELPFSRIAVRRFGLNPHEKVVGEADTVAAIDRLVSGFDEPFGNSSAIPSFYCADLARRDGKELLLAGDGGDEIFGGNERYAKDQIFRWFHESPAVVRTLGSLIARLLRGADSHLANRIGNMIHRGNLPNPDRFYSDDSFASDHFDQLLSADFRAAVGRDDSLQVQRDIYARADTTNELHRLMYLDLQMTIAESDVVKVVRSAAMAGVDVDFPYLDADLVAYTGRLPARFKVNVLKKRYLFKRAMAGILPPEILQKKKQGFGLPLAVWLKGGGPMRDVVNDILSSRQARERGLFEPAFVARLSEQHERGSWDYSSEIFRLLMLELWHREYLDA